MEDKAQRSGAQGEQRCLDVFGVTEPDVEVKSAAQHNYQVVVKLSQLERQTEKLYVIVVYDRQCRRLKSGPRKGRLKPTITIEKAFKEHPVEFITLRGYELVKLIIKERCCIRFVTDQGAPDGHFVSYIRLNQLREWVIGDAERLPNGDTLQGEKPENETDYAPPF